MEFFRFKHFFNSVGDFAMVFHFYEFWILNGDRLNFFIILFMVLFLGQVVNQNHYTIHPKFETENKSN